MKTFYYFNDKNFPIQVTRQTVSKIPYTFNPNGILWENASLKQFFSNINPNEPCTIIDVGAQAGLYSLYAKYLPQSTFYSFEPFKLAYTLLEDNIKLNNLGNIIPHNIALSDKKENKLLHVSKVNPGLNTLGNNVLRFSDGHEVLIECDTIDNLFAKRDIPVDYIKIDTEGWEYFVLHGALETIKKYRPTIQLEWNTTNMCQCNIKEEQLKDLLFDLGYKQQSHVEEEKLFVPT